MITLGIDLSSMRKDTAACLIDWSSQKAIVRTPEERCDDGKLDSLIEEADVVGIDAPFGWPQDFVRAVGKWESEIWDEEIRDQLCFRETDRFVRERTGRWPLSVSTNQIALPAMRAMALLRRHRVTDHSGDGRFFEVYPAGSLKCWELQCRDYKGDEEERKIVRRTLLEILCEKMPQFQVPDEYIKSDHSFDALVASLTARAATQGRTTRPTVEQFPLARLEGWIHLPTALPAP